MVDYIPDSRGIPDLMRSVELQAVVREAAEAAETFAEAISPVLSGAYRDAFRVEESIEVLYGEERAVAYLINDVPYAFAVEADHHVLVRTADYIEGSPDG